MNIICKVCTYHICSAARKIQNSQKIRNWLSVQLRGYIRIIDVGERTFVIAGGPLNMYIVECIHGVYTLYIRDVYSIYSANKRQNSQKWRLPTTMVWKISSSCSKSKISKVEWLAATRCMSRSLGLIQRCFLFLYEWRKKRMTTYELRLHSNQ